MRQLEQSILDGEYDPDAWKMTLHSMADSRLSSWLIVGKKQKQKVKYQMQDITKSSFKIGNIFNNFVFAMDQPLSMLSVF